MRPELLHFKPMFKALQLGCCWMVMVLFLGIMGGRVFAQETQSPMLPAAFEFVQRILSAAGSPGTMSVSFQNISVFPPDLQETVQNAIFTSVRNSGVQLVQPETAIAQTEITFSENWHEYVWVARVQQGTTSKLVMKRVPRPEHTAASRSPMMTVRKGFVWRQDSPMLDFAQDEKNLAILEPTQIAIYSNENGNWRPRYTLSITHAAAWPRDLRGRVLLSGSQVTAFLPGTRCNGSTSPPSSSVRDAISSPEFLPGRMPAARCCRSFPLQPGRPATRASGSSPEPMVARVFINMIWLLRQRCSTPLAATSPRYIQGADQAGSCW